MQPFWTNFLIISMELTRCNSASVPPSIFMSAIKYLDSASQCRVKYVSRETRSISDFILKRVFYCVGYSVNVSTLRNTVLSSVLSVVVLDVECAADGGAVIDVLLSSCKDLKHLEIYSRRSDGSVMLPSSHQNKFLADELSKSRRDSACGSSSGTTLLLDFRSLSVPVLETLYKAVCSIAVKKSFHTFVLHLNGFEEAQPCFEVLSRIVSVVLSNSSSNSSSLKNLHVDVNGLDSPHFDNISRSAIAMLLRFKGRLSYIGGSLFDCLELKEYTAVRKTCPRVSIGACMIYDFLSNYNK